MAERRMLVKKRFYAVIHVEDFEQASVNAACAYENGADGIFLINHSLSCEDLLEIYHDVRKKYPDERKQTAGSGKRCDSGKYRLLSALCRLLSGGNRRQQILSYAGSPKSQTPGRKNQRI
jgi:hypothetical protein